MQLVDRELERCAAKLRKHKRNTEKNGRKSVDKSRFNPSSDGELMHKYVLRYRRSLNSMDRTYERMRKREVCGRAEDGRRRKESRDSGRRRRDGAMGVGNTRRVGRTMTRIGHARSMQGTCRRVAGCCQRGSCGRAEEGCG